ncbi:MAG: helix-turn-helix domain-containing protein, partial [Parachlamydiaceae bacterium]
MRDRKAKPIEGLDKHDFDKLARSEGSASERKRFLAFAHIKEGKSFSEVARMIRVEPRTVIVWVKNFRKFGIE